MPKSRRQKSLFDERADFSARIVSLPFIRNHAFARNDIKGAVFRDFPAFSKAFHEMPKKKTVNLRLKNEILCLTFAFREQIRVHGGRLFFAYSDVTIVFLNQSDVIVPSLIWHFLLLIRQYSITCSATLLKKFLYPLYSDTFLL